MSKMKKLVGLLLAMIMVLAMSLSVFADDTKHTITINGTINEGDTFNAYQIFSGDESNGVLSNISWGSGVNDEELLKDLNKIEKYSAAKTAEDVANILKDATDTEVKEFAEIAEKHVATVAGTGHDSIANLEDGYYLVKSASTAAESAETRFILTVVKNAEVTVKSGVPTSEKKVKDVNDSKVDSQTDWQDSADYDIGDEIPYQLKATLPEKNIDQFKVYKVSFVDTISKGLTYKTGSAVVKVNGTQVATSEPTTIADYKGEKEEYTGGKVLRWDLGDVKIDPYKAGNNAIITIEYTAVLNENANIGAAGNPNEMHIEYTREPNNEQGGTPGETPDDKVTVFTFKTVVNKVDQDGNPLAGAAFKLQKKNASGVYVDYTQKNAEGEDVVVTATIEEAGTKFTFTGLDDGDYKLVETTTPAGYNSIEDIEFTVTAEHDTDSDDPNLTSLTGTAAKTITFTSEDGTLSTKVENRSGSTLPSTGGMGTTMFYLIGALCVAVAGVLLISRKRVSR